MNIILADFLKTNLTTFAVIWVKRRQKAGFLGLISSTRKGEKGKSEEEERMRREKSNGCTHSFYNGCLREKKLLDTKGPFGGNVFKTLARIIIR